MGICLLLHGLQLHIGRAVELDPPHDYLYTQWIRGNSVSAKHTTIHTVQRPIGCATTYLARLLVVVKRLLLLLQRVLHGVLLGGVVDVRHRERKVYLGQSTAGIFA